MGPTHCRTAATTRPPRPVSRRCAPRTVIPPDADYGPTVGLEDAEHIARHDPVRVLAEVEVKRRIVDEHGPNEYGLCDVCVLNDDARRAPCPTLRLLTLPYADHPDYRGEWRPD